MKGAAVVAVALCVSALMPQYLAETSAVLGTPRSTVASAAVTKPMSAKQNMLNELLAALKAKITEKLESTISIRQNNEVKVDTSSTMNPGTATKANNRTVASGSTIGPVSTTADMGTPTPAPVAGVPIPVKGVKDRTAEPIFSVNGKKVTIPIANILRMEGRPFSSVSTENTTTQNAIVDAHNAFRRSVDPPASNMLKMKWNTEAAATATAWAKGCNQNRHSIKHERTITNFTCGENLFMSSFLADWSDVIASFDNEKVDFEYGSKAGSKNGNVIGHYTQVVWYRSFQVGCAVSMCPNSFFLYYYVCHYCPPGNTQDMFGTPYKTGEPCGDCPEACDNKLCTNSCGYQDGYNNCNTFLNADGSCTGEDLIRDCPATCKCKATNIK